MLGRYVRDSRVLTLAETVRKMTGLPASMIGMVNRGFIAVGMAADRAVFDAGTVIAIARLRPEGGYVRPSGVG